MELLSNYDLLDLLNMMPTHEYLGLTSMCTHLRLLKNEKTTQQKREESKMYMELNEGGRRGYTENYYVLPNGEIDGLHILDSYDGRCATETHYVNGNGTCRVYVNDLLFKQGEYIDNMREGIWEDFYDSEVCGHANYHHDKKDGIYEYWINNGDDYVIDNDWITYVSGASRKFTSPVSGQR